ncbi:MAG: efflux RND transporter permease subunit [Prolixibacteraceae bacterium]|nr:efflux RND transporter permease subunit [Prolixibacteraceae bacterium]
MNAPVTNKPAFSSFSVIVVFLAFILIGIAFIPQLDVRYEPSRDLPRLTISFNWSNASPKVIEEEASKIEGVLGKVSQVKNIESSSSVGSGRVTIEFDKTADIDKKRYEVSTLMRQLRSNLPDEMSYPEIRTSVREDGQTVSFITLTLNSSASTYYIEKIANRQVIPSLLKIDGIEDVRLYGSSPYQWEITFDPEILKNYNLAPGDIGSLVNQLGSRQYLGNHKETSGSFIPVLASAKSVTPEEWGALPVANSGGRIVKLSDIASIRLKEKPPTSYYRINGKNVVNLVIFSAPGNNQLKLSKKIREELTSIRENLPIGYSMQIASDTSEYIRGELTKIGLRTLFSLLILLLFVLVVSRSFRILAILTIALISNLLIAVVFYYLFKVEIHIYSLAGITVSFGIIIDNSIIMVSHLQKQKGLRVFISLLAATLTTLGALSVIFFLKDNQKILLVDFTFVMLINLSVSLVVSLFLVPALMEKIYRSNSVTVSSFKVRRIVIRITQFYNRFILFEEKYKWAFLIFIILAFGLPVNLIPEKIDNDTKTAQFYNKTFGSEIFKGKIKPVLEKVVGGTYRLFTQFVYEGSFYSDPGKTTLQVTGSMPEGCTIDQLNDAIRKMEQYISQFSEIEQFETRISGYQSASIIINFTEEAENSSFPYALKSQIESKVNSLGGMDWGVYGVGRGFNNSLNSDYKNNHILLTGYNYDQLYKYAEQLEQKLLENERVERTEINSSGSYNSPTRFEFFLKADKELLAMQNLNLYDYTGSLHNQLYDGNLNAYYNENELQPVKLISTQSDNYNKWAFYNLPVDTRQGQKKLSEAGEITKRLTGKSIIKINQVYQMYLNYNFNGAAALSKIVQERAIEEMNDILPLGYKVQTSSSNYWYGNDKNQYLLLLLIIVIIYFITAVLFESLLKPLAVISLIPISFIGVFLTFYLFGFNFDQGGFASFILLSGLVVNAAIYIINDYNNLIARKNKPTSIKTYLKAYNQKIVAITLTILSTVLGLVPFVWGGQKEVFWFAFAVGAMGGLLFSLVAIFIYLPLFLKLRRDF